MIYKSKDIANHGKVLVYVVNTNQIRQLKHNIPEKCKQIQLK